ncbi:MAG: UDP-N-acetylmuramate dehydrogenase [Clostridia bacterium]|nr:UDP-N-acetylmuramate dehydrogenase [Clostridia bacterium]
MDFTEYIKKLTDRGIAFSENEPMSRHVTFRIGGEAMVFVMPETLEDFTFAVKSAYEEKINFFVLGKGSNVLFADGGYEGAVISAEKLNKITVQDNKITCLAGASFTAVSHVARDYGLSGLEFANGIPGSVGGAVYMNAGAYGGEVSQVLKESTYFDTETGETVTIGLFEHNYSYRKSSYIENKNRIILSAVFSLTPGDKAEIKEKMDLYMLSRKTKQPLEYPSAGSVFKRCQGHYTGQMIEELGLKGYSVGGAQISEKHAGFIINKGGATARDVEQLIDFIKERVKEAYGVELECEVIAVK